MTTQQLESRIKAHLPYIPNTQQTQLIAALSQFCQRRDIQDTIFILNGYAGTGKTSLTAALVEALADFKTQCVLLAPTGRAAKVLGNYAGHKAYTIHRYIYRVDLESGTFCALKENKVRPGTVFIVDESSMIDTRDNEASQMNLLEDLLQFVFSADDCRLIFLGDTAQLPPVGNAQPEGLAKALKKLHFHSIRATLTTIARQSHKSGILYNATWQRKTMMNSPDTAPKIFIKDFDDVNIVEGYDLAEEIERSYHNYGIEETIIITRSNKRAVEYNKAVRSLILERTQIISKGDILMVAKNNYFWKAKGLEFIANGDIVVVEKIIGEERLDTLLFADAIISFPDHEGLQIEVKLNLSCLVSEAPALSHEEQHKLALTCIDNPVVFPPGTPDNIRIRGLRGDPYYNALQVKYGYAITCHKAQGGQWKSVFIDIGFIPSDATGQSFYRWLYTATTRASEEIHFINPPLDTV